MKPSVGITKLPQLHNKYTNHKPVKDCNDNTKPIEIICCY